LMLLFQEPPHFFCSHERNWKHKLIFLNKSGQVKWRTHSDFLGNTRLHHKITCVLRQCKKGLKITLNLIHEITGFPIPLHLLIGRLALLFSTIKFSANNIFMTSSVWQCIHFRFQRRFKTLSTWTSSAGLILHQSHLKTLREAEFLSRVN
jgi:hypothetical protein